MNKLQKKISIRTSPTNPLYIIGYTLVLWLITLSITSSRPGPGLDTSWIIAIHHAISIGTQFGTDIIFNYGPLGHLMIGPVIFDYNLWIVSLVFKAGIHLLYIASIVWFLTRCNVGWPLWILFAFIFYLFGPVLDTVCYEIQISALLTCWILIINPNQMKKDIFFFAITGGLLATTFLIKVNTLFLSGWIILATGVVCILVRKEILSYLALPLSFCTIIPLLWIACNQKIENLFPYLFTSMDLISGYSEAMAQSGPNILLVFAFLSGLFIIILLAIPGKTRFKSWAFIIMALFIFFSAWKHGFVRQDGHILIFLQIWGLLISFLFLIRAGDILTGKKLYAIILWSGFFLFVGAITFASTIAGQPLQPPQILNINSSYETINLLHDETFNKELQNSQKYIRKIHPIPKDSLKIFQNHTVDIYPWEISTIWAHNLKWSNRPIIQSQNVYTHTLDTINEGYLITGKGPEYLLYHYDTIDGRYQPGDEPATWRAIISHYDYHSSAGEYLLLKKKFAPIEQNLSILSRKEFSFGEKIPIPNSTSFLYASFNITPSKAGFIVKTLFRPDPVYIQFTLQDGSLTPRYRIIPDLLKNPMFISEIVDNQEVLRELFINNNVKKNMISSFSIYTESPWQYQQDIDITYFISDNRFNQPVSINTHDIWMMADASYNTDKVKKIITNINGLVKKSLFIHPPKKGETTISCPPMSIPENATLQLSTALDPRVNSWMSDGVVFHVYIKGSNAPDYSEVWNYYQKPDSDNNSWINHTIDLGGYDENPIEIRFSTSSGPSNNGISDLAWIGDPMIVTG